MKMHNSTCPVCESDDIRRKFAKQSKFGNSYTIFKCKNCRHECIYPLPSDEELAQYYDESYFTVRTERGYNNYFSEETKEQINRVSLMNLHDIHFVKFEHTLPPKRRSLDIGCAAGYFVELLQKRGWDAFGIDVSAECTAFAKKELGLPIIQGDYLNTKYSVPFDLITLWATIEHLPRPDLFLAKARGEIYKSGRLYLSTCRSDSLFKRIKKQKWRYYNVPEHIHYFSKRSLSLLLEKSGFAIERYFTYGSGIGPGGSVQRKGADFLAKKMKMGDMIVVSARPV